MGTVAFISSARSSAPLGASESAGVAAPLG